MKGQSQIRFSLSCHPDTVNSEQETQNPRLGLCKLLHKTYLIRKSPRGGGTGHFLRTNMRIHQMNIIHHLLWAQLACRFSSVQFSPAF